MLALDGSLVDTSRHKAIALLVYLAVTGERQRREALATLLWPDYEQSKAYAYLRRTLWEVKEMVGEGWLDADRELVGFVPGTECWFDVAEFHEKLASAANHGHATGAVCSACIEPLSRAAELYRGDFLAGFSLRDSPGFDDWQFYLAEGLRQEAGETLRKLSAIHGQERKLDAAIDYGRRWLVLDPLNEDAHRQVMLLYALHGRRSAALRQYQECVRILQAEMGVAPERKTTELFQRIEQGKIPALEPAATVSPVAKLPATSSAPPAQTVRSNLPQLLTPFIGRERELAELHDLFADPDVRLLTILAVGGMGKTRLAIEAAARQIERFEHGAVFVYLAPLQRPEALAAALLNALNLDSRDETTQKAQLLEYLRKKRLLLALDNFEHLLEGAGLVSDILEAAPGVKVLATSRIPLNLQGEHRYHLAGMDFPAAERLDDALDRDAVKLFVQGARRSLTGFKLAGADVQPVAAICRLAEGMPLAILLAAGWVALLTPQEIAAQMRSQHDFLETELHDVPQRQRSMRLVMQQAWEFMSEPERAAFASLSVFRGSFDRQAAQEVSGASLRVLMSLIEKSMLARLANDRLVVHELLRQYAAERLVDDVDIYHAAHDRHSARYCRRLHEWAQSVKHPGRPASMVEIETDLENAQAAWQWAARHRQVERLASAAEGMGLLLSLQNRNETGEAVFAFAGDALDPPTIDQERVLLSYLLARQALFASSRLSRRDVAVLLDRSLAWLDAVEAPSPGFTLAKAFALWVHGLMAIGAIDWRAAQAALEESLVLFEQNGESWWVARVLQFLGRVAWARGDRDRTRALFQRSLAIHQEIGDQVGAAWLLTSMGGLAGYDKGQIEEAERCYRESSRLYTSIGGRAGEMGSLDAQKSLAWLRGRFPQAVEAIERLIVIASEQGHGGIVGSSRASEMYEALQLMGQYGLAKGELSQIIVKQQAGGWIDAANWSRPALVGALLGLGEFAEALQVLHPNIVAPEQAQGEPHLLGRTLALASRAELGLGNLDAAWEHALRAVNLLTGQHYFLTLEAMAAAAAVLAERGEAERAVEIYALLNRHEFVANARWFADVFGQVVEQAAATLPPEIVAAAKARGETFDLWQAARELLAEYDTRLPQQDFDAEHVSG